MVDKMANGYLCCFKHSKWIEDTSLEVGVDVPRLSRWTMDACTLYLVEFILNVRYCLKGLLDVLLFSSFTARYNQT